jgi:hypothetical protein
MTEGIDERSLNRRRVLGVSLGATAAVGSALLLGAPHAAAATATATARPFCPDPVIPVVPGMVGDPRANQLWYELDEVGFFNPSQEFIDAIVAIGTALGNPDVEVGMAQAWRNDRLAGTYPGSFITLMKPLRAQLKVLSDIQAAVYREYYNCDRPGLISAMAGFGQGILFDPRRPANSKVHMMNGKPPVGYLAWHAFNRAFALLGIKSAFWNGFDPIVGFGWVLQSTTKPVTDADNNPPLPAATVVKLARQWLRMSPRQLDDAFMSFPYPAGIS